MLQAQNDQVYHQLPSRFKKKMIHQHLTMIPINQLRQEMTVSIIKGKVQPLKIQVN
jgi:hypothetical protein